VAHDVVETFYDLQGATANALRDEMNLKGPRDPNDHKPVDALTWSDFRWEWNTDCTLHMVNLRTVLTLPRYVGSDTALRQEFTTYASALRAHEERHVTLARRYGKLIAEDLRTRTAGLAKKAAEARDCPSLNRLVQPSFEDLLARFSKENAQLDLDTNHGISEGACWLCR
jgi:predicted secreted Zn-dependent protease